MDAIRFDAWTKALLAVGTRRTALRLVAGGAAGVAALGLVTDATACRKAGKKCKKNKQCCSKQCLGKKCFCSPLKGSCPGPGGGFACCPQGGEQPGCLIIDKAQCGPPALGCYLGPNQSCLSTCDCGADLVCGDSTGLRCCWLHGHACVPGANDETCCSATCGCASAAGACTCRHEGCKSPGQTCSQLLNCCDGICESGKCCQPQGLTCTATAQCCAGLFCDGGVCDTP